MAVMDPADNPAGEPTARAFVTLAVLVAAVLLAALPVLLYPLGRDQGEFATIGRGILDGKTPYVDLWNPKPPAIFYVTAASIAAFGRSSEALRVMDLLLFPPVALALFLIGRRISSAGVGLWAALLFGVFYFTETFWTLTQNDGIALLPMTWAIVCAIAAGDRADRASAGFAFAAGALTAAAMWFKYPFVLFLAPVIAAYWAVTPRMRLRDVAGFALGGLLIGGGGILTMVAIGAWDALWKSAVVTSRYTALGASGDGNLLLDGFASRLIHWSGMWLLAAIAIVGYLRRRPQAGTSRGRFRDLWAVVIVWMLAGFAIMLIQLKGYDYHWLPMFPPLVILSAFVLDWFIGLLSAVAPGRRTAISAAIALLLLLVPTAETWGKALPYLSGQIDRIDYDRQFVAGDVYAHESEQMAQFLRERVAPGDSLFIWGFRPEVYYLSGLNPAVRFIFQFHWRRLVPTGMARPDGRNPVGRPPPYVLVLEADYLPWVTGSQEDSHTLLLEYTELRNWLEFNYTRDTQIGPFLIWRRLSTRHPHEQETRET
ncbi:MAG: glycosyltransferase family 39 protein [Chloroflexi bacterium]|nr:glycosyltransferase family 39 protein [Chloroflexota bacterium]